ncbi:MAG: hypothetical protein ABSC19_10450 [Syntrophorhabdales bacterium]|jgi:hypothetical protein
MRRKGYVPFVFLVVMLLFLDHPVAHASSGVADAIRVERDGRISADIADLPLGAVLSAISQKLPVRVLGRFDANERITIHFSGLTLPECVRRLMAGYNYVLMQGEGPGGRLTVTVMGRIDRRIREVAPAVEATGEGERAPIEGARRRRPSPQGEPGVAPPAPQAGEDGVQAPPPAASAGAAPPTATTGSRAGGVPPASSPEAPPPSGSPPPVAPPATPPPLGEGQPASDGSGVATPPGIEAAPESQPDFNPAAWGGRGRQKP